MDARDVKASKTWESIRERSGISKAGGAGPSRTEPDGVGHRPSRVPVRARGSLRDNGDVVEMSRGAFEGAVQDALDLIPAELAAQMDNVVVLVEDDPPAGDPGLLGVYEGVALTERDGW